MTVILSFRVGSAIVRFILKMGWVIGVEALQRGGGEREKEKVDEEEEKFLMKKRTTRKYEMWQGTKHEKMATLRK